MHSPEPLVFKTRVLTLWGVVWLGRQDLRPRTRTSARTTARASDPASCWGRQAEVTAFRNTFDTNLKKTFHIVTRKSRETRRKLRESYEKLTIFVFWQEILMCWSEHSLTEACSFQMNTRWKYNTLYNDILCLAPKLQDSSNFFS